MTDEAMTTTPSKEAREAAAAFIEEGDMLPPRYTEEMRAGLIDHSPLVQAFHRFQLEERKRCARIVASEGHEGLATAIRQQEHEQ